MAQRSKSFRFRIPWLSVPSESFSRRTKDRQKSPPHSDTSVSIERPYKPSVVASSELSPPSPTKTEEAPTDEHQKQSPSHPTQPPSSSLPIESSVSTQPKSPSPQPPLHPSSHADTPPHVQVSSSSPITHLASDNGAREVSKPNAEEITAQSSSSSAIPSKTDENQKQSPSHPTQPPPSSLPIESSVSTQPKSPSPQPPLHPSSHADTPPHVQVSSSSPKTHLASDNGAREVSKPNAEEITAQSSSSSSISPEKTVSFSGEEAPPLQKGIKDDITKFVHKLTASVHPTQPMDEKQFSIITLAGDNRGATMHLGSESAKKEGPIRIHRAYKSDHEEINEVTTNEEENTNEGEGEGEGEDEEVGMAYVNSNIQSINNSLMFDGSIKERDPGVQLTLPQKPNELTRPDNKLKPGLDTQRTQFNMNRAERSPYQPTVGRSIRGCKFSCDKDIEDIDIL